jgi:hypothetical protein
VTLVFDVIAMVAAFISAILRFMASGKSLRRVQRKEVIDEHDINRIVTAFNRNQILNARAALATAISATAVGLRFVVQIAGGS